MIAQVLVDVSVPQLDRLFDYAVPAEMEAQVKPGIRVKVRFNGRLVAGFVAAVADNSDFDKLVPLSRVVSEEVVLPAGSIRLIRAVADHCAGTFMDVARLAVPPRLARAEKAGGAADPEPGEVDLASGPVDLYPAGTGLREALRQGRSPRAAWTLAPVPTAAGDWAAGLAGLVASTVAGGRDALVLVPDATDCARALAAVRQVVDSHQVVTLTADQGPQARYSAFLAAVRGRARVVVGTRAAAYVPLSNLGLIAVWDEADGSFAEQRFPYPHLRDIVAIRASQEQAAVVFAAYARSAEIQQWVEKGWLREVGLAPAEVRPLAAGVRIASQDDRALDKDPAAHTSRLPHDVFTAIRAGLAAGPVLVWVPWLGGRRNLVCRSCGEAMRCPCGGAFAETGGRLACQVCGRGAAGWACACGGTSWRAITIGSARTAEELARAFPSVAVVKSDSTGRLDRVGPEPAVVIATGGCEPPAEGGYRAAVILDAQGFLSRPDIHAGEEAVRRWLAVVALVAGEGTVVVAGPPNERAVQALARLDPVGFARRELADRREAGFPPACRMAVFTGPDEAVAGIVQVLSNAGYVQLLGPVEGVDEAGNARLVARVPSARGEQFAALLAQAAAQRSANTRSGRLAWRLDPDWLGG